MDEQKKTRSIKRGVLLTALIVLLALLVLEIGALVVLDTKFIQVEEEWVPRDTVELDLRGGGMTLAEYRELSAELPQCRILWDIPVGSGTYDSTASTITVERVDEALLEVLPLFENLQEIDAAAIPAVQDLERLRQAVPGCRILWTIHMEGVRHDPSETVLDLSGTGLTVVELLENLSRFEALEQVTLRNAALTEDDKAMLLAAFPNTAFVWDVEVLGKTFANTDTLLSFAGETVDPEALASAAGEFAQVAEIDLSGCGLDIGELTVIQEAYPGSFLRSELTLYGQTFRTDAETLDFSGIPMESTEQVAAMAALMPKLQKVDMCDCGISNEEMDALNKQFENTLFVWRIHFSVYTLRTDATYFCASDLPQNDYVAIKMTDEQLEPLKYCTELIALDLGHMQYTDLSFLENMPKLRYLILVEARFSDISPIASLKELEYLELFVNTFDDLTPLLECKSLRNLNIGFTRGYDPSVLKEMVWLERLWYPGHGQDSAVIEEITAALPNTLVYAPAWSSDGSTGNGWRETEEYYEMRDIFHMHYMPGGTGTDNLK